MVVDGHVRVDGLEIPGKGFGRHVKLYDAVVNDHDPLHERQLEVQTFLQNVVLNAAKGQHDPRMSRWNGRKACARCDHDHAHKRKHTDELADGETPILFLEHMWYLQVFLDLQYTILSGLSSRSCCTTTDPKQKRSPAAGRRRGRGTFSVTRP